MKSFGGIHQSICLEQDRLPVVDALRGFALLGILFVNLTWFTGFAVIFATDRDHFAEMGSLQMDTWVHQGIVFLVDSKFWSIFALLFGVGMGIQLLKTQARPAQRWVLRRRLITLLVIGLIHGSLIWFGDIISLYALTGFALLLFANVAPKALLRCGVFFLLLPILQGTIWLLVFTQLHHEGSALPDLGHGPPEMLGLFAKGNISETLNANVAYFGKRWLRAAYEGRLLKLLGMFLLGVWVAQTRLLTNTHQNRSLLRRIMVVGLGLGIPGNWYFLQTDGGVILPLSWHELARVLNQCIAIPAMACGYTAAFALAYFYRPEFRIWRVFALVGRLSLTHYITHSIIGVLVFYGWGLGMWGKFGVTTSLTVVAIIFVAQAVFSHWWLSHFRYGPLEWLSRCVIYATWLPMRIHRDNGHALVVANNWEREN